MAAQIDQVRATHRLLLRTYWKLQRAINNRLEPYGLTGPQFGVLVRTTEEGVPLTQLAERLFSDVSTVNGIVNRLENQGLVERRRCTEDRRVVFVQLTSAGRITRQQAMPEHHQHMQERYGVLTDSELATLQQLLKKLMSNL